MRSFSGGFYSDGIAIVRQNCFPCNNGTYVPPERAPGKSVLHCIVCPTGKIITYLKAKPAFSGCTLTSRYARNKEKIRQRGSLSTVALGICQLQLNFFVDVTKTEVWFPPCPQSWRIQRGVLSGIAVCSTKTALEEKRFWSWRQILQFLVNLTACWMKNMTPKTFPQCLINLYDVILSSQGRLGKQTSDLKITFEKFTYPSCRPYSRSLSLLFPPGVIRWIRNFNKRHVVSR